MVMHTMTTTTTTTTTTITKLLLLASMVAFLSTGVSAADNILPGIRGGRSARNLLPGDGTSCVAFKDGKTDNICRTASTFERYKYTYACDVDFACCDSTSQRDISNVPMAGNCRRNYVSGPQGCIAYKNGTDDWRCQNNGNGFSGFGYSYKCTDGLGYACCNTNRDSIDNVDDLGYCQRNTTPAPTQRPTAGPTSTDTGGDGGLLRKLNTKN